ncbi:MAG: hypothetical protein BWZ10_00442 [candidate division BRC1 bacterium ADurb.BinA364]|nr:MAG: hypothetical protein BWZ10_00442 [candidate division BRC1 bacterium ADurb.BinA364]
MASAGIKKIAFDSGTGIGRVAADESGPEAAFHDKKSVFYFLCARRTHFVRGALENGNPMASRGVGHIARSPRQAAVVEGGNANIAPVGRMDNRPDFGRKKIAETIGKLERCLDHRKGFLVRHVSAYGSGQRNERQACDRAREESSVSHDRFAAKSTYRIKTSTACFPKGRKKTLRFRTHSQFSNPAANASKTSILVKTLDHPFNVIRTLLPCAINRGVQFRMHSRFEASLVKKIRALRIMRQVIGLGGT